MFNKTNSILIASILSLASAPAGARSHCGESIFRNPPSPQAVKGEGPAGVGMEINQDRAGHYIVMRLEPDGPAAKKKVLIGDRLLAVNRHPLDGLSMDETVKLIRGESETSVRFKLQSGHKKRVMIIRRQLLAASDQLRPPTDAELKTRQPTLYDRIKYQ